MPSSTFQARNRSSTAAVKSWRPCPGVLTSSSSLSHSMLLGTPERVLEIKRAFAVVKFPKPHIYRSHLAAADFPALDPGDRYGAAHRRAQEGLGHAAGFLGIKSGFPVRDFFAPQDAEQNLARD